MDRKVIALALTLTAAIAVGASVPAAEGKKGAKEGSAFSALRAVNTDEAKTQALAWLKSVKPDAATKASFDKIWSSDATLLDRVAQTLELGSPEAAKVLVEARNADAEAPTTVPALLKDKKQSAFLRANLALAYGRALATRKVYEEGLEALSLVKPDDVVDPSAYFFHKAVCEHALMLKDQADATIDRLLVDVADAPERYRMVAALMHFDMLTWADKDLGWIARKMDNIQRRLALHRGGKQTQKMQREVLVRLDEMIKKMENDAKPPPFGKGDGKDPKDGSGDNGGSCPPGGGQPGNQPGDQHNPSGTPMQDSNPANAQGTGQADSKRIRELAEVWGKLPEKDRAQAMQELTRGLPPKDRAVIEEFLRRIQQRSSR